MKKIIVLMAILMLGASAFSGQVGLPQEQIALPVVQGSHLVCIWDEAGQEWMQAHASYDHSGSYRLQLPEWGNGTGSACGMKRLASMCSENG